jgi:hypothetical protein
MHPPADQAATAQPILERNMLHDKLEYFSWQRRKTGHGAFKHFEIRSLLC